MELILGQFGTTTGIGVVALRMAVAALLAGLIGLNREWREKPAGLKTHILIAVGAATFALLAIEIAQASQDIDGWPAADPVRVVQAMITGVAFLGAGAIIRGRDTVAGITTGASIWIAGAIGLACGAGFLGIAILAAIFGIVTLTAVQALERLIVRKKQRRKEP